MNRKSDKERRSSIKRRDRRVKCLFSSVLLVILLLLNTEGAFADGEIFLYRGELYSLSCLMNLREDQEYEIFIENPDIVGLGENGKQIVAVAAGTSEVTVSISNPDAAYSYVFVVSEYGRTEQEEFDEYGQMGEGEEYEAPQGDRNYYDISDGREYLPEEGILSERSSDTAEERNGSEPGGGTSGERNASEPGGGTSVERNGSEPGGDTSGERGVSVQSGDTYEEGNGSEQRGSTFGDRSVSERFPDTMEERPDPEEDISGVDDSEKDGTFRREGERQVIDAPIHFDHGRGLYDLAVPKGYTLWISTTGRGKMTVLYVGFRGVPVPYHIRGRMIFIRSDDLQRGSGTIQVVAANEAGKVYTMSDYGICVS